jgi:PAS domain S-box-containing protein
MKNGKNRILLIEDTRDDYKSLETLSHNKALNYAFSIVNSVDEARNYLALNKFDALISDYILIDGTAFDFRDLASDTPLIVVDREGDDVAAVRAMKAGAFDYMLKDSENNFLNVLPVSIEKAILHKKTQERLRLLESAVVHANDAIIILEAEPGEDRGRKILYVNDAFTGMTGYSFEEATDRTLRMLRGPKTSLAALNKVRIALEQYRPVRVELINYRKDGTEFWVECNIVPFRDEKGQFTHWVSVQRDITERKIAEQEKEKLLEEIEAINADLTELNKELETIGAERTLSLMALTVADRIRNPATMIGCKCRRILQKEELTESLRKGLHFILEGAEQLDKIVRDFETLLKNRQLKFHYDDLNTIVESIISVIKKEAVHKDVEISVHITGAQLRMNMQRDLLRVAVFHVIKNAVEATSPGQRVTIETRMERDNVILIVSDSGFGIPEEEVDNIFKPFFSTKEDGYGMGLPLAQQIVSEHMGELLVESRPGHGSTFKLVFPTRWKEDNLLCSHCGSDQK